jgi:hypothetical protein
MLIVMKIILTLYFSYLILVSKKIKEAGKHSLENKNNKKRSWNYVYKKE